VQQEASEVRGGGEAQSEGHPEKSSLTDVPHVGGKRRGLPNGQLGLPKAASPECLLGVATSPWTTAAVAGGSTPLTREWGASIDRQ
jgi:hypothetical protein